MVGHTIHRSTAKKAGQNVLLSVVKEALGMGVHLCISGNDWWMTLPLVVLVIILRHAGQLLICYHCIS